MSAPRPTPASPGLPGAGVALLVWVATLVLWGVGLDLFGTWLYGHYTADLGWGSRKSFFFLSIGPALIAVLGCANKGWKAAPMAILAASIVALTMAVNFVAAAVVLWALDPALATGRGGYLAVFLAGLFLSLPVAAGVLYLLRPPRAWEPSWREWFRNDSPRGPMVLRVVLSAAVLYLAWLAASEIMFRLAAAYPAVKGTHFVPQLFPVFAVAMFVATASLPDMRAVLRTLLGALVLFEAVLALAVSGMAVLMTLQSDNILLAVTVELLMLAPIYLGASILVAHRPGDRDGEATGEGQEEAGA